jgi:hypothetical protein
MSTRALLLSGVFFAALAAPAWADDGWGEDIEVMDVEELDVHRGGFMVAGINFNFGATITTLVNGVPALTTSLTWTDVGAFVEETIGEVGENINTLTDEQRVELGIDGLENAGGVIIADEAGVTALVHNVTEGSLQNIIINNATGRDLTQEIDVTVTLPGFELIQDALQVEVFGMHVSGDLSPFLTDPGG